MSLEYTKTEWAKLPASIQETLLGQGAKVIEDPVEQTAQAVQPDLLANEQAPEEEEEESGLFLNIWVLNSAGERVGRLTYTSLDTDFIKFNDKEHTQVNQLREAVVSTVDKHGFPKAKEGIKFEVEMTKKGESQVVNQDLLA